MVKYYITDNNLHIENSYKVYKRRMNEILNTIAREDCYQSDVWLRTFQSLEDEWIVHNFLYKIGLWRPRTKGVDLDYPCDRDERIYKLIAGIVYPFVK